MLNKASSGMSISSMKYLSHGLALICQGSSHIVGNSENTSSFSYLMMDPITLETCAPDIGNQCGIDGCAMQNVMWKHLCLI